ncbi:MAG: hypothetical protein HY317_04130 [Acidobacteria bacterium]|nr:hypothetical protein [Acidobacteriota bacterium]
MGNRRTALGIIGRAALAAAAAVAWVATPASAYGPVVHQAVTAKAVDTLPSPLKSFYKSHRLEMPTLAPEPTLPEEGQERRFAVDRLLPFPFLDLPRGEEALRSRFGDAATGAGRLPWLVHTAYDRLVEAFRSGDKARILAESDALAGLVTDLHNPLALAENADGQKTEQHGLWVRFSVKLPEVMGGRLKLGPGAAHFLDEPKEYVFAMMNATYVWLDNLLYHEELARRGKAGYTEIYYDDLAARAGDILKGRLSQAAGDVGSYWYTAWTAAGRPAVR